MDNVRSEQRTKQFNAYVRILLLDHSGPMFRRVQAHEG